MLPEQGPVAETLDSLSLSAGPGLEKTIGLHATYAKATSGLRYEPPTYFWYRPTGGMTIESLIVRVGRELERIGHVSEEAVVRVLLALIAHKGGHGSSAARQLNALLTEVTESQVMQFYVFPGPGAVDIQVGSFRIAPLDAQKLAYWSQRSGSDYFQLWGDQLKGRVAIERAPFPSRVLPLNEAARLLGRATKGPEVERLIVQYFSAVARAEVPGFWDALVQQQDLFVACGAPFVPEEPLKLIPGCDIVTIFARIGDSGRGWVAPDTMGPIMLELGFSVSEHRRVEAKLRKDFRLLGTETGPMHEMVRTYVRFLARAWRYQAAKQPDEALLHAVIALELLLVDESQQISAVLQRRAALLSHRTLGRDYVATKKMVGAVYDARSRYVHEGLSSRADDLADARRVCEAVLYCLFRVHSSPSPTDQDARHDWLRHIDLAASHLEAGQVPSPELLTRLGIAAADAGQVEGGSARPDS